MKPILLFTLLTGAWATTASARFYLPEGVIASPTPERFSVCHAYGCKEIDTLAFSAAQWAVISAPLTHAASASDERRDLREAIGHIERIVGAAIGTDRDEGGTFGGMGEPGQMDCLDESTNTTTYLRLFAASGLLRHHTVEPRATRGFFLFGWPHTTAVIRENGSDRRFAVDSWFHDNGVPPEIVPLEQWSNGYHP